MPKAEAGLPTKVKIGAFNFPIAYQDEIQASEERYRKIYAMGMFSRDDQIIKIKRLIAKQRMVEVLLHEIFHGLAIDGAIDQIPGFEAIHEDVVDRFSKGVTRLIADNPGFMAKLEQAMKT